MLGNSIWEHEPLATKRFFNNQCGKDLRMNGDWQVTQDIQEDYSL